MPIEHSKDLFKPHWVIWKLFGLIHPQTHRIPYFIWCFLYHSSVTFFYPLHLILGLLKFRDQSEIFKNLAIDLTDLICSLKFILIWYNLKNIFRIRDILSVLDDRIETNTEKAFFQKSVKNCKYIFCVTGILYFGACISSELTTLFGEEKRLLYPAWLPIDWSKSATNYWIANMYQFIGITFQILTNFGSDTYPPVCLALLSGHTQLLAIRLSALGMDPEKSSDKNSKELKACIQDHKRLIECVFECGKP